MSDNNKSSKNSEEILSNYNVPAYLTAESNFNSLETTNSQPVKLTTSDSQINHKEEESVEDGIYSDSICLSCDGVTTMVNISYKVTKITDEEFRKRAEGSPQFGESTQEGEFPSLRQQRTRKGRGNPKREREGQKEQV